MTRERHPFALSRRKLGALLAAGAALVLPATVEAAPDTDAQLLALEHEAKQSDDTAKAIQAARIDPHEAEFERLMRQGSLSAALAFGQTYDRDGIIAEMDEHFSRMDHAINTAFATPAGSAIGRAAKTRMLVRHYFTPLREPFSDLDYDDRLLRLVLAEYAGMTADDFAAI